MMNVKFSEDVVPLSSVKINPGKLIKQADETHRPVLLTSRGKGVAVIQSLKDYEKDAEERDFMRAVMQGSSEIDAGKGSHLTEVESRLGL
ncbi:MAG: type II toxin-antitoxin system Phd/YefM family antitoxin [Mariprofundales bacterium]|nr:type II toxin-antitoxin system Phd/YefM family antitoxin [Mariprofundales bacterium]